ncbi:MAG: calcium-binding protein, partial [Cyanobacteria bacterium J06636_27]
NIVGGTLDRFSLEDGDPSETASDEAAAGNAFLSNFSFTITEPTASITIPVIDDLMEEADANYTYTLVEGDGYKVDSSANSITFDVTDGVVGDGGPTVGVSATPTTLYESEQTAVTLTFTTAGDIPAEGLVVVLEGPPRAIAEFDVNGTNNTNPRLPENETVVEGAVVSGGSIVGTDETAGSLIFRITDPTATVTIPVFQDEVEEGAETLTFNLQDGEAYNVDQNASAVSVTIEDVKDVVEPTVSFSTTSTTISEANGDALVMEFKVEGDIPEGGITVNLEGDAARIMQQFTVAQTRFDAESGEIFYRFDNGFANNTNDNIVGGTLDRFSLEDGDPSETASDEA